MTRCECARCAEGILIAGHCVDIDGDYWHECHAVDAANTEPCRHCHGAGSYPATRLAGRVTCAWCKGTGKEGLTMQLPSAPAPGRWRVTKDHPDWAVLPHLPWRVLRPVDRSDDGIDHVTESHWSTWEEAFIQANWAARRPRPEPTYGWQPNERA
jgi:hypothetical protein